jgi:hypothetical protein
MSKQENRIWLNWELLSQGWQDEHPFLYIVPTEFINWCGLHYYLESVWDFVYIQHGHEWMVGTCKECKQMWQIVTWVCKTSGNFTRKILYDLKNILGNYSNSLKFSNYVYISLIHHFTISHVDKVNK